MQLTDADVTFLYRALLGRPPESADTVAAFRAYYPTLAAGRRAVLTSDEFRMLHPELAGGEGPAARLAAALLRRAGGALPVDPAVHPAAGALMLMAATLAPRVGVVWGDAQADVAGLAPLGPDGVVLHAAAGFPGFVPLGGALPGGARLFRMALEPAALAALLDDAGLTVDWLALSGEAAPKALPLSERFLIVGPAAQLGGWPERADVEAMAGLHGLDVLCGGGWHLPVRYAPPAEAPCPADAEAHPALALAAIVRNEAASLPHMLASALPVASFVVIVDTGSEDGTADVAREILAASGRPFRVASVPAGAFDAMRNAALDLVPEWAAWTLMLDADEALAPEDHAPLLALLSTVDADAVTLPRYNYQTREGHGAVFPYPDRQVRLLRNTRDRRVRYSGAVHETVRGVRVATAPLDAAAVGLSRGGPHIHHYVRRFRTPAEEAAKQAYYRALAEGAA